MDSIIFDVDGTLWDSTDIVADAWTECLKEEFQIPLHLTSEKLKPLFGQLLPDIARQLFPEYPEEKQLEIIGVCCDAEHRALLKTCAPLYPRLEETLRALKERYPLFIVSNCQAGYIEVFLEATGFSHLFQGHLCPGDTGMAKAENILKIKQNYSLKDPVYVGDTMGDFQACQKAGVPFIFASYGFGSVTEPDHTILQPADLLDICL